MVLKQPVSNNIFAGFYERERERESTRLANYLGRIIH